MTWFLLLTLVLLMIVFGIDIAEKRRRLSSRRKG